MTPFFLQPYNIFAYLQKEKQIWPAGIVREVYLSWEDALWDLLPRLGYKKNSLILVPSFYCTDVVENMVSHGYRVEFYQVGKDLVANEEEVRKLFDVLQPDVVINFSPEGMGFTLPFSVARSLHIRTLLITDMVHRIPQPSGEFFPENNRHLILNSYRKVTPFTGAVAIYTRNARERAKSTYPFSYFIRAFWLWHQYLLQLWFSKLLSSTRLAIVAEKTLKKHNDLIGDSFMPASLWNVFFQLYDRIAVKKIEEMKIAQSIEYYDKLSRVIENKKQVWLGVHDYSVLDDDGQQLVPCYSNFRGFPLIMTSKFAEKFLERVRQKGFLAVVQLGDCEWSKKYKLILLPLGPEVSRTQQEKLSRIVSDALTMTK